MMEETNIVPLTNNNIVESSPIDQQSKHTETPKEENHDHNISLKNDLSKIAQLIANINECFTAAIFTTTEQDKTLVPIGVHTLSQNFNYDCQISFGKGLIGWCAENKTQISVCPFSHDSTTLLCYSKDQDLKSFIAVPVLNNNNKLIAVIACDSKKKLCFCESN